MSDPNTFRGEWWVPGARDRAIIGTLTFDRADGLTLDAIGLFRDPFEAQGATDIYPIIHGRTTDSKDVTLCRCIQTSSTWGTGVSTSTFTASVAFVDAHVDSLEDVRFSRAYAALVHLPRWAGISRIRQVITPSTSGDTIDRLSHEFSFSAEHASRVEDWEIRFVTGAQTQLDYYARAVIEQTASVQLEFDSPRSFDELVNGVLRHIQDFLSLAVGRMSSLLELRVVRAGEDPRREAIRVLYGQGRRIGSEKPVDPDKMVFTLKEVRDMWPEPLRRYVAARDQIRSAMDLYFAVVNSPGLYIEVQFLNMAQALEAMHRGTREVTLLAPAQFAVVRERIELLLRSPELALPEDPRESLAGKVEYWNEVTLRHRLRDLVAGLQPAAQEVIGDASRFVRRVVNARNYLTHRDPRYSESISDVPALVRLTHQLEFLVEQNLLQLIGVPDEILDRHAKRAGKEEIDSLVIG